jgi:DNA-binding Xre family transcriptional regulator
MSGSLSSKLEREILHGITVETLERLADVLDCTTDELLGRSKPKAAKAAAEGGVRATARS